MGRRDTAADRFGGRAGLRPSAGPGCARWRGKWRRRRYLESVRRGWPVFVVAETGGLADSILQYWNTYRAPSRRRAARLLPLRYRNRKRPPLSSIEDVSLREIVDTGDIRPIIGSEPGQRPAPWRLHLR